MTFKMLNGNSHDLIDQVEDQSIQLIITSPPYNLGKIYEMDEVGRLDDYLDHQTSLIEKLKRILHPTGSIIWQVGNFVENGEIYPLDMYYYPIFKRLGFQLRNRLIWHFEHGLHAQKRFSGRYETLLWLTLNDDYVFNLDRVRIPSKYPGKRHFKGDKKGEPSGNPNGKNPSDFWTFLEDEWSSGVWEIPNVKANHPEKTDHPCQFPVELVERCVLAFTRVGDTILDPYAGVGSTLIAALKNGRNAIGFEKEQIYVDMALERIENFQNGKLKTRPVGQKVHYPKGKIAEKPKEWQKRSSKQEDLF